MLVLSSAIGWDDVTQGRGTGTRGDSVEFLDLMLQHLDDEMKVIICHVNLNVYLHNMFLYP